MKLNKKIRGEMSNNNTNSVAVAYGEQWNDRPFSAIAMIELTVCTVVQSHNNTIYNYYTELGS